MLTAACLAIMVAMPGSAHAGNFYEGNVNFSNCADQDEVVAGRVYEPCLADNARHVFYRMGPLMTDATDATLYQSYDTTAVNVYKDSGHYSTTDAFYENNDGLPAGVLGRAIGIYDNADPLECDHFHVQYHGDYLRERGWDRTSDLNSRRRQSLACHESGHALGLTHGEDADPTLANDDPAIRCMRTPFDEANSDIQVGTHNAAHLNDRYSRDP